MGTPPLIEDALRFMEELQASSKTQQVRASAKDKWLRMVNPQAMDWTNTPIDGREVGALNLYLRAALPIRRARRAGSSGRRTLRRSAEPAKTLGPCQSRIPKQGVWREGLGKTLFDSQDVLGPVFVLLAALITPHVKSAVNRRGRRESICLAKRDPVPEHCVLVAMKPRVLADHDPAVAGIVPRAPRVHSRSHPSPADPEL
jgi:hypothetical protein